MKQESNKIIFFPKQKEEIEHNAFFAMKEKKFDKGLRYFEQLIDHGVNDRDIILGKLTCLIELGREREAEDMCEELIAEKDENFFSYINIYATLLFQSHKHKDVAQLLEETLGYKEIPETLKSQLEKLYDVNQPLVDEQIEQEAKITKRELVQAFDKDDHLAQWHLVNHLQNTDIRPYIILFEEMLQNENVHPVIKTVIVGLLQAQSIDQMFKISKFGSEMMINPSQFPYMNEHPFRLKLRQELTDFEQDNPIFYQLSEQIIDRFFQVSYPFSPEIKELNIFKDAVISIVKSSFEQNVIVEDKNISTDLRAMINQIIEIEKIYFSIMDE